MNFSNKICVVTGGANGIGLCIVNEFAKSRAKVAFIDLDKSAGEKALASIQAGGTEGLFYWGDIAEKEVLEKFAGQVIETYGRVDYLINNACLSRKGIISGCDYDDFNYVLKVGVTAPYMLAKLFQHHFGKNGAIVNISSTRKLMSQQDTESYTAAKGGISALTHALAVSLAGKVRVNSVSPGWIDTSANYDDNYDSKHSPADKHQHPVRRIGKPLDIARAVMFLCDEENGFITGENITVDGGMTKQMIYNGDYGWEYSALEN
jgi:NAD(P)-dependent dehydrogenase (short-subunit alcohol dehydrogenase family)